MAVESVLTLLLTAKYVGGSAFSKMASDIDGLVTSTSRLEQAGAVLSGLGTLMLAAGTATAVGLGYAVAKAAEYQQSLTRIQSVTNYTGPQMQQLSNLIMDLSDQYGISSKDIADGSYFILSSVQALGYGFSDVMNANILPAFAAYVEASGAGKVGAVDFVNAAQDLHTILGGMHVPINDWATALGDLNLIENQAALSQQQLVAGFSTIAPQASLLNMRFDETSAMVGTLASLGIRGAKGGTELAAGLRQMMTSTTGLDALKKLGIDPHSFFDKSGQFSMMSVFTQLVPKLNAIKDPVSRFGEAKNLFGAVGARAFFQFETPTEGGTPGTQLPAGLRRGRAGGLADLLSPGTPATPSGLAIFSNLLKSERTKDPVFEMLKVAAKQASGPQAQFDILKQTLTNLAITIGTALLPVVLRFTTNLDQLAHNLREFATAHPKLLKDLAVGAVPALLGGGLGLKGAGGLLSFLGKDLTRSSTTRQAAIDALAKERGFPGLASKSELLAQGWKPSMLEKMGEGIGKVAGFGSNLSTGLVGGVFKHLGAMGRGINAMGEAEVAGKTFSPGTFLAKKGFNLLPHAMAARQFELGARDMGATDAHPHLAFLGGAMKDIGGGVKGIVTGPLEKLFGLFKNLLPAIKALPGALVAFSGALLPILAIALVIAGVIAIVVLTFLKFRKEAEAAGKTIGAGLTPIFKFFGAMFKQVVDQILAAWQKAWPAINTAMQSLFKELPKILPLLQVLGGVIAGVVAIILSVIVGLVNGFLQALPFIIGFVSKVISLLGDIVKFLVDVFTGNWKKVGQDLKAIWSDIWGIISNFVGMIVHFIGGFIQGVIGFFQNLFDILVGHSIIPDMITGIITWFLKLPGNVLNAIATLVGNVTKALTTFATNMLSTAETIGKNIITGIGNGFSKLAGWLGGIFGNVVHGAINAIPGGDAMAKMLHIPGFAAGTLDAPGGLALVGERGPELVMLPQHSQVVPNGGTAAGSQRQSGSDFFWMAASIRDRRLALSDGRLPVTYSNLPGQLDLQYRYMYQKTA